MNREGRALNRPIITLTTDFGTRDAYVAQMKGVILGRCPEARIVDMSHDIGVRDVVEAALFVAAAIPRFPEETYHVIVIDPGVGSERFPIAAKIGGRYVFCPNNGALTLLAGRLELEEVRVIASPSFMLEKVSATFHGRDIFSPAAATLASGAEFDEIGPPLESPVRLRLGEPIHNNDGTMTANVVHVDHFGNLVTNVDRKTLEVFGFKRLWIGEVELDRIVRTYGDVPEGEAAAIFGSTDFLEIAVNRRSASEELNQGKGSIVTIES